MNFRSLGFTGVSVLLFSACMVEAGDDDPEGGGDSSPGLSEGGAPPGAGDGDAADDSPASLGKGEIATGTGVLDPFGIEQLYPSNTEGDLWTSEHWAAGDPRAFMGRDPSDPTGWSVQLGTADLVEIDGQGTLRFGGKRPMLYLQPPTEETGPFFKNVEFTGYFRRMADEGGENGGFFVGVRTHANGHGTVDHCMATTYYLVFRNSGLWFFNKELDHPQSEHAGGGDVLEGGGAIPIQQWIGMKFIVYNTQGDTAVKLEAYVDSTSNGEAGDGVSWRKLGEVVDDGNWESPVSEECGYPANTVITEGHGAVLVRSMEVSEVQFKMLSFREIAAEAL